MITSLSMALSMSLLSITLLPPSLLVITTTDTASIPENSSPEVMRAPRGRERKAVQALRLLGMGVR